MSGSKPLLSSAEGEFWTHVGSHCVLFSTHPMTLIQRALESPGVVEAPRYLEIDEANMQDVNVIGESQTNPTSFIL